MDDDRFQSHFGGIGREYIIEISDSSHHHPFALPLLRHFHIPAINSVEELMFMLKDDPDTVSSIFEVLAQAFTSVKRL